MPILPALAAAPPALNLLLSFAGLTVLDSNVLFSAQTQAAQQHFKVKDVALANVVFPRDGCPPFGEDQGRRDLRMSLAKGFFWDETAQDLNQAIESGILQSFKQCDEGQKRGEEVIPCVHSCYENSDRVQQGDLQWFLKQGGLSDEQSREEVYTLPGSKRKFSQEGGLCYFSGIAMKAVIEEAKKRAPKSVEEAAEWTNTVGKWAGGCVGPRSSLFKHIMRGVRAVVQKLDCRSPDKDALEELEIEQKGLAWHGTSADGAKE